MNSYKYPDAVVLVFAKAPVPGNVNTRLIPDIGVEAATNLQAELIHSRLKNLQQKKLCATQLWCSPDVEHEFFQDCKKYGVDLFVQHGEDLGARMSSAIKGSLSVYKRVVLIGTDAPSLTLDQIEHAIQQLAEKDVVIGPADDGGYVLIGMSQHSHAVFQSIHWGSEKVLAATREKIQQNSLSSFELESCWDIDRVEDYRRYKK